MDKQKFAEACPKLQESLRLDPGMGTQFNLAHCWEKLGLTASAWGLFLDVAAAAQQTGQRKRERAARERAAALEPQLSRLRIDVPSPAPGMKVQRAGEEVGQGAWGTDMPIDPGTYAIEASAPEKRPWSGEVVIAEPGKTVPIEVPALEDLAPVVVEAPEPQPAPVVMEDKGTASSGAGRVVATVLLGGLGVGGVVTGTIFGLEARSETNAARSLCTGGADGALCDRDREQPNFDGGVAEEGELQNHREEADRAALISYVAFGVGGAALIGSAILLFTGSSGDDSSGDGPSEAELRPTFGPDYAGFAVSGRF
jgi:serine/threonine-protein kinase